MARLEDVQDEDSPRMAAVYTSVEQLLAACNPLVATLQLPQELLGSFMDEDKPQEALEIYHDHALRILSDVHALLKRHAQLVAGLGADEQWAGLVMDLARLSGQDPWTTVSIRDRVQAILSLFSATHRSALASHILSTRIKSLFIPSPHPMLSASTQRALPREAGGPSSSHDYQESSAQAFKTLSGWGCYHVISWCCCALDDVERAIGLVLPPTLVLMDDWEPLWRVRGVRVLESWRLKVDPSLLKRMGVDKLLLKSMLHSLSLHSSIPLIPTVLRPTLALINSTTPKASTQRATLIAELVDKTLLTGWMYAPSGIEGRPALIAISQAVQILCEELGTGIIRWLKNIIPALLDPLRYPPTHAVFLHMQSNVSSLLAVLRTTRGTGRIVRWRGQILDAIARLWAALAERQKEGEDAWGVSHRAVEQLKGDLMAVVADLATECPSLHTDELPNLLALDDSTFRPLIPV